MNNHDLLLSISIGVWFLVGAKIHDILRSVRRG